MRASTTNIFGQLRSRDTLLSHYILDMLPYMHKAIPVFKH